MKIGGFAFLLLIVWVGTGMSQKLFFPTDTTRAQLATVSGNYLVEQLDDLKSDDDYNGVSEKKVSGFKVVLMSAILPGSGELSMKNWKRGLGFLMAEAAGWAIHIQYNKRGDDKDGELKSYADTHWSEQRYWTKVYIESRDLSSWQNLGYDPSALDENNLLPTDVISSNIDFLRQLENENSQFTHSLPTTKTQQYYEMIGKYAHQFGYGWDDASFSAIYSSESRKITDHNLFYTDIRAEMNDLYKTATRASQFLMINHLLSALDAGFLAKQKNNAVKVSVKGNLRTIRGEMTEFAGVVIYF